MLTRIQFLNILKHAALSSPYTNCYLKTAVQRGTRASIHRNFPGLKAN